MIQRFEEYSIDEILFKASSDHAPESSAAHRCGCCYNDSFMDCLEYESESLPLLSFVL